LIRIDSVLRGEKEMEKDKSIGQIMEDEELAMFRRAGVKAKVVVTALYEDGSEVTLYERDNSEEL